MQKEHPIVKVFQDLGYLIERPADPSLESSGIIAKVLKFVGGQESILVYSDKIVMINPEEIDKDGSTTSVRKQVTVMLSDMQQLEWKTQNGHDGLMMLDRNSGKKYVYNNIRRGNYCANCKSSNVTWYSTGGRGEGKDYLKCEDCGTLTPQ